MFFLCCVCVFLLCCFSFLNEFFNFLLLPCANKYMMMMIDVVKLHKVNAIIIN